MAGTTPPPSTATTAAPTTATPTFAGFSMKRFCDAVGPLPQFSKWPNPTSTVPVLAVLPSYDPRSSVTTVKQIFSGFANTTIVEVPGIVAELDASCLTSPAVAALA